MLQMTGEEKRSGFIIRQQANRKVIFRKEPKFEQVTDNTYPVLAWHPSGKILTYINDEKADLVIVFLQGK